MNLPPLPAPDTHCFDDDTGLDCWSHSAEQMREYGDASRKSALEEVAKRSEAYAYMSRNFTALAEEIRSMK